MAALPGDGCSARPVPTDELRWRTVLNIPLSVDTIGRCHQDASLNRPGNPHVVQVKALFFVFADDLTKRSRGIKACRYNVIVKIGMEDKVELQPFGFVQRHDLNGIAAG